jgi:hypothetical protein
MLAQAKSMKRYLKSRKSWGQPQVEEHLPSKCKKTQNSNPSTIQKGEAQ